MRQRTANCLVRDRVTASEAARGRALAVMAAVLAVFATGCVPLETSGLVRVDGSSTVYPIQEAVAEAWLDERGGRVVIGVSGTGGGFSKFCRGELDITGASRPIKPSERALCASNGITFVELPVAYDGVVVVVHPDATWVDHVNVDELRRMWEPAAQGVVMRWRDVRPSWPDAPLRLLGPGIDSGTYDYFTLAVVGTEHASRGDFMSSEDDNVLVQGVAGDVHALGFFGYAYYLENAGAVRAVAVDADGDGGAPPVLPTIETVTTGAYTPLSRPLFVYVATPSLARPGVEAFLEFYLTNAAALVPEVGFIALPEQAYELARARLADRVLGTVFADGAETGVTVEELLRRGGAL